jgi:hypothetical protein
MCLQCVFVYVCVCVCVYIYINIYIYGEATRDSESSVSEGQDGGAALLLPWRHDVDVVASVCKVEE